MSAPDPREVPTKTFEWGQIKWFITPEMTEGAGVTFGEVIVMPGKGHDRHNHHHSEEILYILSGRGEQMVADGEPFPIGPGDTIHIPAAVFHYTRNTGWEPMRLLAFYNPGGAEKALEQLEDFRELTPHSLPGWSRDEGAIPGNPTPHG